MNYLSKKYRVLFLCLNFFALMTTSQKLFSSGFDIRRWDILWKSNVALYKINSNSLFNPDNKLKLPYFTFELWANSTNNIQCFSNVKFASDVDVINRQIFFEKSPSRSVIEYRVNELYVSYNLGNSLFIEAGKKIHVSSSDFTDVIVNPYREISYRRRERGEIGGAWGINGKIFGDNFDIGVNYIPKFNPFNESEFANRNEKSVVISSFHFFLFSFNLNLLLKLELASRLNPYLGINLSYSPKFIPSLKLTYEGSIFSEYTTYSVQDNSTQYFKSYRLIPHKISPKWFGIQLFGVSYWIGTAEIKLNLIYNRFAIQSSKLSEIYKALKEDTLFFYSFNSIYDFQSYQFSPLYLTVGLNLPLFLEKLNMFLYYRVNTLDASSFFYTSMEITPDPKLFLRFEFSGKIGNRSDAEYRNFYYSNFVRLWIIYSLSI